MPESTTDWQIPASGRIPEVMRTTFESLRKWIARPWLPYTPTWLGTAGTAGTVGNGTLQGRYREIGKCLYVGIDLICGTTTTFGTGYWGFSLPTGYKVAGNANTRALASAWAYDTSAGAEYVGVGRSSGAAGAFDNNAFLVAFPNALAKAAVPFVWANADLLSIYGCVERL